MCLIDFYMGNHSKQKANEKSSQLDSAKKAANIQIFPGVCYGCDVELWFLFVSSWVKV